MEDCCVRGFIKTQCKSSYIFAEVWATDDACNECLSRVAP